MDWSVQLFELNYDHLESDAVGSVLDSRWLTLGDETKSFEGEFSRFLGGGVSSVAVSSCTAALHMSLVAAGIGPGDEVIIPALTFVADANVVRMVGASPILADVTSLDDWNVCSKTIAACITDRTKAVIVVHFAGYPIEDITNIKELCSENSLVLIEDVAHAPGASIDGKMCGTFGDFGCFSFFSNKNLSIGEGGMVVANTDANTRTLASLRSHGMTSLTLDRHRGRAMSYDVARAGLNYRIDEIRAALGRVQLAKLVNGNMARMSLTTRYRDNLSDTSIMIPFSSMNEASISAYHIMPVLLPKNVERTAVIRHLKEAGIQTSIHYPPFWSFTAFGESCSPAQAPRTEAIVSRELTLPLFPTMTERQVDLVCEKIKEVV